ncbi:MAG: fumarate hydratase subunit beta [Syntrophus sp. SKADARSKE-3]|nr:fumarate hydratase subunit beta [Syntrophus sp. SKADARSKE-3]
MKTINIPLQDDVIRPLSVGDPVLLSGVIVTGRDAAHKWLTDLFIRMSKKPSEEDGRIYGALRPLLNGGAIYHCGPVVATFEAEEYRFVAAGPTTSIREEPYQGAVMKHFNIKAVIGKGGMGMETLKACREVPAVYLHAIGGAASLIAQTVVRVLGVHKLEFGMPEAMWVIEVKDFPAVVTMDAHGNSLHEDIERQSQRILEDLIC